MTHSLVDTIRPDWPAESTIRVVKHYGDISFIELTSMTGPDENWSIQLDRESALALAESTRLAATGLPSS